MFERRAVTRFVNAKGARFSVDGLCVNSAENFPQDRAEMRDEERRPTDSTGEVVTKSRGRQKALALALLILDISIREVLKEELWCRKVCAGRVPKNADWLLEDCSNVTLSKRKTRGTLSLRVMIRGFIASRPKTK